MASTETGGGRAAGEQAWEWEAVVPPCGVIRVGQQPVWLGPAMSGRTVTFRADQDSIHVSSDGSCFKSVPSRLGASELQSIADRGARPAGPAPAAPPAGRRRLPAHVVVDVDRAATPPPPPAGQVRVRRRVPKDGVTMVANQRLRVGRQHAGKIVTIVVEDTRFRITHDGQELGTHPRTKTTSRGPYHTAGQRRPR
jgi:hypothetical protein